MIIRFDDNTKHPFPRGQPYYQPLYQPLHNQAWAGVLRHDLSHCPRLVFPPDKVAELPDHNILDRFLDKLQSKISLILYLNIR